MKVLMLCLVNDLRFDQRIRRSARALAAAGHSVIVVGLKTWETSEREDANGYTILRLATGPFPLFPGEGQLRHLRRLLHEKPDVVHVHDVYALLFGLVLAKLGRSALVYDSHEYWRSLSADKPHLRWTTRVERIAVPRADLVIVPSDPIGIALKNDYGARRWITIRNIPDDIEPAAPTRPVTWPADRTLTFWGAIKSGRMLEACASLLYRRPELHMMLAGTGELARLFEEPAIIERTHLSGAVSQAELLGLGDTATIGLSLVGTSTGETQYCLPNKLFEYIRAGLPVIATDLPEQRAILEKTGSGILISPGDGAALETAIDRILENLAEFRARAAAASSLYPWRQEAEVLTQAYRNLAVRR